MPQGRWRRRSVLGLGAAGLSGCLASLAPDRPSEVVEGSQPDLGVGHELESWERYDPAWSAPTGSPLETPVTYEPVVEHLEVPWGLSFAANGDLFISERTGRILRYAAGDVERVVQPADVIDDATAVDAGDHEQRWWAAGGEGGLLGVAAHPTFPEPPVVYAYYTYEARGRTSNRLVYFDVSADDPAATERTLFEGVPAARYHNGARLTFGPENYLWVTTGDGGMDGSGGDDRIAAQDPQSLAGKVLRMEPDGSPAPDNPDLGGDPRVYSLGHRNPQGIAFLPDGTPVVTEHGPGGHDEVLVIEAGANFGWPRARRPGEYRGTDYARPLVNTEATTWAPSGCVFYTGDDVPGWSNRLAIGTLLGQHLNVVTVHPAGAEPPTADGGERFDADWLHPDFSAVSHRALEDELGRIRHVEQGPDGGFYAITTNRDGRSDGPWPTEADDRLVRIVPQQ